MKLYHIALCVVAVSSCDQPVKNADSIGKISPETGESELEQERPAVRMRKAIGYLEIGNFERGTAYAQSIGRKSNHYELAQLTLSAIQVARVAHIRAEGDNQFRDTPFRSAAWREGDSDEEREWNDAEQFVIRVLDYYRKRI